MIEKQYRITIYYTQFFSELLTYDSPILPLVGDLIEVLEERTMFVVQQRSFKTRYDRGLIAVTLYGIFEQGEEIGQHTYEKIRERVQDQHQGIKRDREGFELLPETLDKN